jgi:mono/diheme cytochrome c family protein
MKNHLAAGLGAILSATPVIASAQDVSIGEREFNNSCAQCHGADGKGQGVMAGYLSGSLPDLTQLQANNGGVFPVSKVYAIIDGTATSGVHGTKEMPAWGSRYMAQSGKMLGDFYLPEDQEAFVRGRILALIEYISTLQE